MQDAIHFWVGLDPPPKDRQGMCGRADAVDDHVPILEFKLAPIHAELDHEL